MENKTYMRKRPLPKTKLRALRDFLYNPATNEVCGRTGKSWTQITIFYMIFYVFLIAFWALLYYIFHQTLDPTHPKYQLDSNIIGTNPGLGFRPMPAVTNVESTLIWFRHGLSGDYHKWSGELEAYLSRYEKKDKDHNIGETLTSCDFDKPPAHDKACYFDITPLSDIKCNKENEFGYRLGQPCILIKLNKIYDWEPDVYKNSSEIPDSMPKQLKNVIIENEKKHGSLQPIIWISCQGENAADIENLGPVEYSPWQGFPAYFFPYTNVRGYQSPIVALRFPNIVSGVLINIECRSWAKNIQYDRSLGLGRSHFEILMD